jgi:hypothetical protein
MRNWDKAKALERLYADIAKVETDPRGYSSVSYSTIPISVNVIPINVNLFSQDIPPILEVLSEAIARERSQ